MGIFDFLKKDKSTTGETGMELPPVPNIEADETRGSMFPELKKEESPEFPDTSLPPLPTEVPGEVPPKPGEEKLEAPKVSIPEPPSPVSSKAPSKIEPEPLGPPAGLPKIPPEIPGTEEITEEQKMPEEPPVQEMERPEKRPQHAANTSKPEFPTTPELPSEETIPDKVPPLEGVPEPPEYMPATSAGPAPKHAAGKRMQEMPEAPESRPEAFPAPAYTYTPEEKPTPKRREARGPIYIKTDTFKAIAEDIEHIKSRFTTEDDTFTRINDVKSAQDKNYEAFRQKIEDVQRKLLFIDRSLFETR